MFNNKQIDAKENLEPNSHHNGSATNDNNPGYKSLNLGNFVLSPFPTTSTPIPTTSSTTSIVTAANDLPTVSDGTDDGTIVRPLTFSEILYKSNGNLFSDTCKLQNNANMLNNHSR